MEVSFSPDIIRSGWLGSKHQLTNYLTNLFLVFYSHRQVVEGWQMDGLVWAVVLVFLLLDSGVSSVWPDVGCSMLSCIYVLTELVNLTLVNVDMRSVLNTHWLLTLLVRPWVTLCGWQNVQIQLLTNCNEAVMKDNGKIAGDCPGKSLKRTTM